MTTTPDKALDMRAVMFLCRYGHQRLVDILELTPEQLHEAAAQLGKLNAEECDTSPQRMVNTIDFRGGDPVALTRPLVDAPSTGGVFTAAWDKIRTAAAETGLTAHCEKADAGELRVVLRDPKIHYADR